MIHLMILKCNGLSKKNPSLFVTESFWVSAASTNEIIFRGEDIWVTCGGFNFVSEIEIFFIYVYSLQGWQCTVCHLLISALSIFINRRQRSFSFSSGLWCLNFFPWDLGKKPHRQNGVVSKSTYSRKQNKPSITLVTASPHLKNLSRGNGWESIHTYVNERASLHWDKPCKSIFWRVFVAQFNP